VEDVRLEDRREQVVRRADRVDVAGEVEIQVLHRQDLRVPAAGRTALDPEDRPDRGLAQAEDRPPADRPESLRQRDGGRRLSLAHLRRRDRRDADQLRVGAAAQPPQHRQVDLGLVSPVGLDLVRQQADLLREPRDRPQLRGLRDLQAGGNAHQCDTAAAASSETSVSV